MTLLGPLDFSRPHSPPTDALSIEAQTRSDIHALTSVVVVVVVETGRLCLPLVAVAKWRRSRSTSLCLFLPLCASLWFVGIIYDHYARSLISQILTRDIA